MQPNSVGIIDIQKINHTTERIHFESTYLYIDVDLRIKQVVNSQAMGFNNF